MRYSLVPALAGLAAAVPVVERQSAGPTDAQILNYALTLEHLEDTFYAQAVSKFTSADFEKLGLPSSFYTNLKEIASDEKTHVSFLTSALQAAGANATAACSYNFGYTDAAGFLATASLLEGVGVSAYLGAAQYIANKQYLTYAGAILTVESRHSAYLRNSQPKPQSPFPSPFDIPLDFDEVYSLASLFITGCPSSNPALPVKAFPALTVGTTGQIQPNQTITLTAAKSVAAQGAFFITTTGPVSAKLTGNGTSYSVVVPANVQAGQEYLVLTSGTASPSDENIVAGPAVVPIADYLASASSGSSAVGTATATATGTAGSATTSGGATAIGGGSGATATGSATTAGSGAGATGTASNSTVSPANPTPTSTIVPSTENGAAKQAGYLSGSLAIAAVFAVFLI